MFILLLKFPTINFIFLMLVKRQVRTTPPKQQNESSEQLCKKTICI